MKSFKRKEVVKMEKKIIFQEINDVTLIYAMDKGIVTFSCVPTHLKDKVKPHRLYKDNWSQYFGIDPMVQVARTGDTVNRDFSAGETTYNSTTSYDLKFVDQKVSECDDRIEVRTYFQTEDGFNAVHVVAQQKGYSAFEMWTEIENLGEQCSVDRVSTFAIGSLSPFLEVNDPEKLILHRLQCYWSLEGRKESTPLSRYNFEDSWSALGIKISRIGARGAMPSRNYHPFVALEDTITNVTWAVQLEAPDSWEIETIHRYGGVVLCGGHADYLYGHWRKNMDNKAIFKTRKAYVSVVEGNLDKACANITRYHDNLLHVPQSEESLPIVYNEYLTSWGRPTIENLRPQLKLASEFNAKYFVIDAGWFCDVNDDLLGDWNVSEEKFPNGLIQFSDEATELGYIAKGIWYEFESVTASSEISQKADWLAHLDGRIVRKANRMHFDFRNKEVVDYLTKKVIEQLKVNKLNYIKIDYNENIGYGLDGAESVGEGLRQHTEAVVEFMKKITREVPNIVLENCSSGGMRHEVTFDTIGSMVSFSDAHENNGGVIIAMDLHRIMQPRTMQIWASILPKLTIDEIYFTMAKAMLGRICLAGQLTKVSDEYLDVVRKGVDFYEEIKEIVKSGTTTLIDTDEATSILNPHGIIRLIREYENKKLCYVFSFDKDSRTISFEEEGYTLDNYFGNARVTEDGTIYFDREFTCAVLIYSKNE